LRARRCNLAGDGATNTRGSAGHQGSLTVQIPRITSPQDTLLVCCNSPTERTATKSEVSLNFHNLTNAKPNLGDIGYVGYAQYNAAGSVIPQVATLQPLTVILQYKQSF
jgi:hypothetical protein